MKKLISTLPLILFCLTGFASDRPADYLEERKNPDFYRIDPVEIMEFSESAFTQQDYSPLWQDAGCGQKVVDPSNLLDGISIGTIINIGRQVWKIVEAGKPKVTVEAESANALPQGVKCWSDLAGWRVPTVKHFNVKYNNAMGINVADYTYKVTYIYGGNVNGKGRYLAGIRVLPEKLKVLWGFTFDSVAKVPNVVNTGSKTRPIAGAEIEVQWSITSPVTDIRQNQTYFVTGEGEFTNLN